MGRQLLFFCSHYQKEVEKIDLTGLYGEVRVVFFPARCGQPPRQWDEVKQTLLHGVEYDSVDVAGGNCIIGPEKEPGHGRYFHIHGMKHCYQMIANPAMVDELVQQGYYLVTPGWLAHWRKIIHGWGFDRETARRFFAESSKGFLLLDTGVDANALSNLRELADYLETPCQSRVVGLGLFDLYVKNIILHRNLEARKHQAKKAIEEKQKELSFYAMAFDLLRTLTQVRREDEVIGKIIEIFSVIFAPEKVTFSPEEALIPAVDFSISKKQKGFVVLLASGGKTLGRLEVDGLRFPEYTEHYLNLAEGMAGVCGLAIENARHYQEIKDISDTDGLTGIANRRRFDESLEREWKRMIREGKPMSLIMCDVDFFKRFNDRYGHPAGDDCLRAVARVLASCCRRPGDVVARYGGEEFAVILPDTGLDGASGIAEKIRLSVENLHIPHEESSANEHVTVSAGVASTTPSSNSTAAQLVRLADQALYDAKGAGRNRSAVQA